MTSEEFESALASLIEQQRQAQNLLTELTRHDADKEHRIASLEESRQLLVQLAQNSDERLDRAGVRDARLEEVFQTIADIAARQDERIRA